MSRKDSLGPGTRRDLSRNAAFFLGAFGTTLGLLGSTLAGLGIVASLVPGAAQSAPDWVFAVVVIFLLVAIVGGWPALDWLVNRYPRGGAVFMGGMATVMLVLEIALFNTTGTLSMCIPYQVLQPIVDSLTAQVWFGNSQRASDDTNLNLGQEMGDVALPVTVDLGNTEMPLSALLKLQPGQVIKLNAAADGPLTVRVAEQVKFLARPGLQGKNIAVQIVHTLE